MPRVDGLPDPVLVGQIPPGCSGAGTPEDAVDDPAVFPPASAPTRCPIRQQRLQSGPFLVSQVMSVKGVAHTPSAPLDRNLIYQTGPSRPRAHRPRRCPSRTPGAQRPRRSPPGPAVATERPSHQREAITTPGSTTVPITGPTPCTTLHNPQPPPATTIHPSPEPNPNPGPTRPDLGGEDQGAYSCTARPRWLPQVATLREFPTIMGSGRVST